MEKDKLLLIQSAIGNSINIDSMRNEIEHFDVIIVGAGLAGLSAGYHLKKADKNLRILIVEAKNRVGGRTQTMKFKCSKENVLKEWDVGGQWVNMTYKNRVQLDSYDFIFKVTDTQKHVTSLLNELNIPTYKQYDTGTSVMEAAGKLSKYSGLIPNTNVPSLIDLQLMMSKINRECSKTNTLDPFITLDHAKKLNETSARGYYYKKSFTDTAKGIVDVAMRAIYGLEASQVNALFATMYIKSSGGTIEAISFTDKDCAQEKRVKGGTQQISKRLLDTILSDPNTARIIYEAPLIEVNQEQDDRVFVKIANFKENREEIFSCRKLISAIPLNQYTTIKFTPELPFYKRNYFSFCKVGHYIKIIITYKKAFWKDVGYSGMAVSDGSVFNSGKNEHLPKFGPVTATWDATTDEGEPALIVFSCGQPALEWSDQDYEFRKSEVIKELSRYFGPQAGDYVDYFEKNWIAESYNGGCPAVNVVAPDVLQDYSRATREPYLNLHLAGTESAVEWQGYMDGAIESGIRVANEVAYCFNKENPNIKYDYSKTYYHQKEEIERLKKLNRKTVKKNYYPYFFLISLSLATLYYFKSAIFK